jgi:hypothetical protein
VRSNPEDGSSRARLTVVGLCLCALLAFFGTSASAAHASWGVVDFFGNPSPAGGTIGGQLSTNPGGVDANDPAVADGNGADGDVYVADRGNNRIQRTDAAGAFISTWGVDVIPNGAKGVGTLTPGSNVVAAASATNKAFIVGQTIEGTGIAPGTTITNLNATTLTLSQSATAAATGAPTELTVAAGPANVAQNEVLSIALAATVTGGNFKLTFAQPNPQAIAGSQTTANIPFNAPPAEVQAALEALSNLDPGDVAVTSPNPGGSVVPGGPYRVEFTGARYGDTNLNVGTAAGSPALVGGSATSGSLAEGGSAIEMCTVPSECKAGSALSAYQGVAINQSTGHLYASNGGSSRRIEEFTASGSFVRAWGADVVATGAEQADEQQRLTVDAIAGQFKLTFNGQTTADLAFDAPAATVQAALASLSTVGVGNVAVSGGPGGAGGTTPYLVAFTGTLADLNQAPIAVGVGTTPLSGGAASATIVTLNDGAVGFEICNAAANCKPGLIEKSVGFNTAIGYPAVAPAGSPNAGNIIVGDLRRVLEFTATGTFVRSWGWNAVSSGPSNTVSSEFEICWASILDLCVTSPAGGSGLGQFASVTGIGAPSRVAVDGDGNIYALEGGANFRVQKFTPSGGTLVPSFFNPQIDTLPGELPEGEFPLNGASAADSPSDIAIDPSSDHVYVVKPCTAANCPGAGTPTERRVYEFDSTGALVDTHAANSAVGGSVNGFAVRAGGNRGYVTSTTTAPRVYLLGEVFPPDLSVAATTDVTATSATLHGTVDLNGGPLHTTYRFEYSADDGSTWHIAPAADVDLGTGEGAGSPGSCPTGNPPTCEVSQAISGLEPNRPYMVRLVAIKGGTPTTSTGDAGDFETDPGPPSVETFAAFWDASSDELVLRGGVNSNNSPATYHFEYGTEPCGSSSCAVTTTGSAGSGGQLVLREERIAGLQAGTTYHFRLVAENGIGAPVAAAERTLTTLSDAACANQALREENNSTRLDECRAFELVSDGEGWGSGLFTALPTVSDDGNRTQFEAPAFGQPKSAPTFHPTYTASRSASGWTVTGLLPDPRRPSGTGTGDKFLTSADLGTALWPESSIGERGRRELQWSLNLLDGSSSAAHPLIIPITRQGIPMRADGFPPKGASEDLSTFVFKFSPEVPSTGVGLLPDEIPLGAGISNLYMISGAGTGSSKLDVVNRSSNPAPGIPGAILGGGCGAGLGAGMHDASNTASATHAISNDGSAIYFTAMPEAPADSGASTCINISGRRVFKRIDGETTVEVSAAQCSPACAGPLGGDIYLDASRDGSTVLFATERRLRNSDIDSARDLYLYDSSPPASGPTLVQASQGLPGSEAKLLGLLDTSADGSRVYFAAEGALTGPNAEGKTPVVGRPNVYLYQRDAAHPAGRLVFVATLAVSGDSAVWRVPNDPLTSFRGEAAFALPSEVADGDGRFLLFPSHAALLPEDGDAARDLYRYDDSQSELLCLSCLGQGNFDVTIPSRGGVDIAQANETQRQRRASADGSAVPFATSEGLADEDLNGAADVYLWREGSLSLVSAGSGEFGASPAGISRDGKNVFFATRAPLLDRDDNNALDIYDARVDGGFLVPPVAPICLSLEECHGAGRASPPPASAASTTFSGAGNRPPKKPCRKGMVRRNGRCVKSKPKAKHKQRGGRRAGRSQGGQQ